MKLLTTLVATGMIVTMLAVAALAQLMITMLPYLAVAVIVALVLRARQSTTGGSPARIAPNTVNPATIAPPRRDRIGAPAPAPGGWVLVPVWVAPAPPSPPVIDAEVITDRD